MESTHPGRDSTGRNRTVPITGSLRPLAPPGTARVILSFDFDGTLHDPASDPPVPEGFFASIRHLRAERGAVWGINTGRSMDHMLEGFEESRFPFLPDWVVVREREIWFAGPAGGWTSHDPWNAHCETEVHRLFEDLGHLLDRIRREVEQHTGAQWMCFDGEPAGIISRTEEEMEWIVNHITPMTVGAPLLSWQRNSIYLRFGHRDYQKGSSLAEVARIHRLGADACFAMGDSHNDVEMLDPAHAAMIACPANAVGLIKQRVAASGGLVATGLHGHGALEALRHFFGY